MGDSNVCVSLCVCPSLMIYCDKWSAINKQQASHPSVHTNKQTNSGHRQTDHQAEWQPGLGWSITVRQRSVCACWSVFLCHIRAWMPVCTSAYVDECGHMFLVIFMHVLWLPVGLLACHMLCVSEWESVCVGCNPSWSGTTQQPVQRPVCIITACPAAQDRQTRLRALSRKTQTSHPHHRNPCGPALPGPALWL